MGVPPEPPIEEPPVPGLPPLPGGSVCPHTPVASPGSWMQREPTQQSALAVQGPPASTQLPPGGSKQRNTPSSSCTQGLPSQQSSAVAHSFPSAGSRGHSTWSTSQRGTNRESAEQAFTPFGRAFFPQQLCPFGALSDPSQAAVPLSGLPQIDPWGLQPPTLHLPT